MRLYAQARGRGAEFYGERYLDADRWVRTNGIPTARTQMRLLSRKEMRPIWRDRKEVDANLEARKVF